MNDELSLSAMGNTGEHEEIQEAIRSIDLESAYRKFTGPRNIAIISLAVIFCVFQLYTALTGSVPAQQLRSIHLGFVMLLAFLLYPAAKSMPRDTLPWYDVLLAVIGALAWAYVAYNNDALAARAGAYKPIDIAVGIVGIVILMEACRRIVGLPILIIAGCFIVYALVGKYMPGFLRHKGYSVERIVTHLYFTTEGIMGTPIGVCATFIFLFVLFGSFLEKTGVGMFFIDLCNALAGWASGGPAKVAVLTSALEGTVSGSSVSNTVGSGSFTIPLMKSLGYKPEFAAAVEAAASTGGQIMPPIMGAAAFLMAEALGLPYMTVAKAAIIPALLYFAGIFITVHLEAKKLGLKGLSREMLPSLGKIMLRQGYLILPLVAIIYFLVVGYTAIMAALLGLGTCILLGVVTSIVQHLMKKKVTMTLRDFIAGLVDGSRSILSVAIACAMAGIIIGIVTLTGIGLSMGNGLIKLSGNSLLLMLMFTMIASLILGMGAPTTANYLITSTIAAPYLITMGVHPLAAHMFTFYFGIVADVTPPVALAAMAGAAIAKSNPMKTGVQATKLAIAAFIIPYMFVFNPQMLLVDATPFAIAQIIVTALLGMIGISAALEGWLLTHCGAIERILLGVAGLLLIAPEPITDIVGFVIIALSFAFQIIKKRKIKT